MKKNSLKIILILPFLATLILAGCNTIPKKKAVDAAYNLENCLKKCDAKLEEYTRAVDLCMLHYEIINPYAKRLADCNHDLECESRIFEEIRERCELENKNIKEEWEKCRQDCLNTFPLELGIK